MRNDILFGILITLLREGKCTYNYLAEKFEVSKRTIQRYCLNLEMSGIPTICTYGRNGGIEILGSFNLNNLFFTKNEFKRLLTHLQASPLSSLDNLDRQIEEKLKLNTERAKEPTSTDFVIDYNAWDKNNKINPIIKLLHDNLPNKTCYEIAYTDCYGHKSTRTISPYKLLLKDNKWYLFAFCHTRNEVRLFKINRIQELSPSLAEFKDLTFTDEEIKQHISNLFKEISLTLLVDNSCICDVIELLNDYEIEETKNCSTIITGTATNNQDLIFRILSFAPKVKLLSPQNLIQEIKHNINTLKELYST